MPPFDSCAFSLDSLWQQLLFYVRLLILPRSRHHPVLKKQLVLYTNFFQEKRLSPLLISLQWATLSLALKAMVGAYTMDVSFNEDFDRDHRLRGKLQPGWFFSVLPVKILITGSMMITTIMPNITSFRFMFPAHCLSKKIHLIWFQSR